MPRKLIEFIIGIYEYLRGTLDRSPSMVMPYTQTSYVYSYVPAGITHHNELQDLLELCRETRVKLKENLKLFRCSFLQSIR